MNTHQVVSATERQVCHHVIGPVVNCLREIDFSMRTLPALGNDIYELIGPLLDDRFVAGDGCRSECRCPVLATCIVLVPWLNEEETVTVNFSGYIGGALGEGGRRSVYRSNCVVRVERKRVWA